MYEFPEEVTFHPEVGLHYKNSDNRFGFRLLVLGKFHYNKNPDDKHPGPDFTKEVVLHWKKGGKYPLFTTIANVLLLRRDGGGRDKETSEIWEHIAFYNYVSSCMPWDQGNNRAESPSDKQWRSSMAPFETALQILKPNAVLMLGKGLSKKVADLHVHTKFEDTYQPYMHKQTNFLGIDNSPFGKPIYSKAVPAFEKLLADTRRRIAQM